MCFEYTAEQVEVFALMEDYILVVKVIQQGKFWMTGL